MTDSSFYAPGGAGSNDLDGLLDVNITDPSTDDVLQYDGTEWINGPAPLGQVNLNDLHDVVITSVKPGQTVLFDGTHYVNSDPLNAAINTIPSPATSRYYFTRNTKTQGGIGGYSAFLVPIKFASQVTIDKFCLGLLNNPTDAQNNGGVKLRAYIYNSNGNTPTTLHKDMGYFTIANGDTQSSYVGLQFTLGSSTTLSANTLYFMGLAYGPLNGSKTNLPGMITDLPGITNPFWGAGIPDSLIQYNTLGATGYYNGSSDWSTFDYQNGTLTNNISNAIGLNFQNPTIGIRVSAVA
jgi:hypothetical protein